MLKKILPIFFILCLVFSLTVPCLALNTYVQVVNRDGRITANLLDLTVSSSGYTCTQSSNGDSYLNFLDQRLITGHSYFVFIHPLDDNTYTSYCNLFFNSTLINTFRGFTTDWFGIFSVSYNYSYIMLDNGPLYDTVFSFSFNIFDLTEMYGEDIPSADDFYNILVEDDMLLNLPTGRHVDSSSFIDFYSSLFHSFDYFTWLPNKWFYPLAFVGGIVSILLVIFVVVFMIKRFTGGKT